jgi:glutaredoxin
MAKQMLAAEGATFECVELNTMSNGSKVQGTLASMTGRRTVPNVFVGGRSIGDPRCCSDQFAMHMACTHIVHTCLCPVCACLRDAAGGGDDTVALRRSGELRTLLQNAGAL